MEEKGGKVEMEEEEEEMEDEMENRRIRRGRRVFLTSANTWIKPLGSSFLEVEKLQEYLKVLTNY